jgi:hypothetical protein
MWEMGRYKYEIHKPNLFLSGAKVLLSRQNPRDVMRKSDKNTILMVRLKAALLLADCLPLVVELRFIYTRTLHRAPERLFRHYCLVGRKRKPAFPILSRVLSNSLLS